MRADKYFLDKFGSRTKAAQALEKGLILLNGKKISSSYSIKGDEEFQFISATENFVSNGGYKLSKAIKEFNFDCNNKIFADIGASTGGFTDCVLQNGAKKVYCVDVGESLLDNKISNDKRIIRMENTNARFLKSSDFQDKINTIIIDVSFISLRLILPVLSKIIEENGEILALIKPQFECENKKYLGKSGILTDIKIRRKIIEKIYDCCIENQIYPLNITNAPLKEKKNVEFIIYLKKNSSIYKSKQEIIELSENLN